MMSTDAAVTMLALGAHDAAAAVSAFRWRGGLSRALPCFKAPGSSHPLVHGPRSAAAECSRKADHRHFSNCEPQV